MSKTIINYNASVILTLSNGEEIELKGGGIINTVSPEQLNDLLKNNDFKAWVDKGTILLNAPTKKVNDLRNDFDTQKIKEQKENEYQAKLDGLALAIMENEGLNQANSYIEAKNRLEMESEKAEQAGDKDAEFLRRASKKNKKSE